MDTYEVIKGFERSNLYWRLKEKNLTKNLRPYALIGMVIWAGWMFQMIWALTTLAGGINYLR